MARRGLAPGSFGVRRYVATLTAVVTFSLVSGCTEESTSPPTSPPTSPAPSPTATASSASPSSAPAPPASVPPPASPSTSGAAHAPAEPAPPPGRDSRFPDPATLIGHVLEPGQGGPPTVDGRALALKEQLGACLPDPAAADPVCPRSIAAYQALRADDVVDSPYALLVLGEFLDRRPDGVPRWRVVDAVVVDLGSSETVQGCGPRLDTVIVPLSVGPELTTVAAAWGVEGDHVVAVDPASLTCESGGD